jgi:hypothetical protein
VGQAQTEAGVDLGLVGGTGSPHDGDQVGDRQINPYNELQIIGK